MGIGNLQPLLKARHGHRLITPHGDREHPNIGEPIPYKRDSLPLMGIGNLAHRHHRAKAQHLITPHGDREHSGRPQSPSAPGTHYPSWGSGTSMFHTDTSTANNAHYPSWGSGTAQIPRPPRCGIALITPHGDRGTICVARSCVVFRGSLPLMGIGNMLHELRGLVELMLITPHGDRELPHRSVQPGKLGSSLPLMGIGND